MNLMATGDGRKSSLVPGNDRDVALAVERSDAVPAFNRVVQHPRRNVSTQTVQRSNPAPGSRCPECGRIVGSENQQQHSISVRATILSLRRFGIASPEVSKRTEKEWARYRAGNRLDITGGNTAS